MGDVSTGVRSESLRHTLVRQALPKTKVAGSGEEGVRSNTPSRALSPTGEGVAAMNGGKTCKRICETYFPHAEMAQIIARQHVGTPQAQHRVSMVKAAQ